MDDTSTSGHPLQITITVAPRVADTVGVVDNTGNGCSYSLESAMWVLREARHAVTMVHAVGLASIEVCTVSSPRSLHHGDRR